MDAEILHEQQGLRIKRNSKNGFVVATLFYHADPAKRRPEWMNTVKAGMTQSQWEKEYEISYTAQFGERCFPEFIEKKELIVVPNQDFEGPIWAGFDYGQRNPSSFHIYTYQDGAWHAVWELYKPCKSIPEFAQEIKSCPYYSRIKYIAADPSMFNRSRNNAMGEPETLANLFLKEGITKLIPGSTDESAWLGIMRKYWEGDEPAFKICNNCPQMIKEFEQATFQDYTSDKLKQTANAKEALQDKNNHAMDDCKYFFNSQPLVSKGFKKKYDQDIASKWYGWGMRPRKHGNMIESTPAVFSESRHPRAKEFADTQFGYRNK